MVGFIGGQGICDNDITMFFKVVDARLVASCISWHVSVANVDIRHSGYPLPVK